MQKQTILKLRRKHQTLQQIAKRLGVSRQYIFKRIGKTGRVKVPCSSRNAIYDQYRYGAKTRNLVWRISENLFDTLTQGRCHYCGCLPANQYRAAGGARDPFIYNGIDRKDNRKGYVPTNSVSCCKQCNMAKRDLPYKDFVLWLDRIKKFW
jgi:hypothetical protein